MDLVPKPKTKFLEVVCSKCKNEQIIFNKPSDDVKCLVCGEVISESTGGFGQIKAKILKEEDS